VEVRINRSRRSPVLESASTGGRESVSKHKGVPLG